MAKPGPKERENRDTVINLRATAKQRDLIDRAAAVVGRSRSEFMLDAACREATAVVLDQRLFVLDDEAFTQFTKALNKAPADNPKLRRLLKSKAPWE